MEASFVIINEQAFTPSMIGIPARSGFNTSKQALENLKSLAGEVAMSIIESHKNAYIAGGLVEKALNTQPHILEKFSDVDIFITGEPEERAKTFESIMRSLPEDCYFSFRRGAVDVYRANSRVIQLVSLNGCTNIIDILRSFDFTHIQVAYGDGKFIILAAAEQAIRTGSSSITRFSATANRAIKTLMSGYEVTNIRSSFTETKVKKVEAAIANPLENADTYAYSIGSFPIPEITLPGPIKTIYMLKMIRAQTPASNIVTYNREEVISMFTPGIVFDASRQFSDLETSSRGANVTNTTTQEIATDAHSREGNEPEMEPEYMEKNAEQTSIDILKQDSMQLQPPELTIDNYFAPTKAQSSEEPHVQEHAEIKEVPDEPLSLVTPTETPSEPSSQQVPGINAYFNPNHKNRIGADGKVLPLECGCEDYTSCTHKTTSKDRVQAQPKINPLETFVPNLGMLVQTHQTEYICEVCGGKYYDAEEGCTPCYLNRIIQARRAKMHATKK